MQYKFDVLIIGTGSAGLMNALHLSDELSIALIAKDKLLEGCSYYAQGGISAVLDAQDNFQSHINDTLLTGNHLGDEEAIRFMVEQAPAAIQSLEKLGVLFTQEEGRYHLTTEGGHSNRRIAHVADKTGKSIQTNLLNSVKKKKNIHLFEGFIAINLLMKNKPYYGSYILNKCNNEVESIPN
jgi:L-aspartate oxidase